MAEGDQTQCMSHITASVTESLRDKELYNLEFLRKLVFNRDSFMKPVSEAKARKYSQICSYLSVYETLNQVRAIYWITKQVGNSEE